VRREHDGRRPAAFPSPEVVADAGVDTVTPLKTATEQDSDKRGFPAWSGRSETNSNHEYPCLSLEKLSADTTPPS